MPFSCRLGGRGGSVVVVVEWSSSSSLPLPVRLGCDLYLDEDTTLPCRFRLSLLHRFAFSFADPLLALLKEAVEGSEGVVRGGVEAPEDRDINDGDLSRDVGSSLSR